jgi:hypothetical protein
MRRARANRRRKSKARPYTGRPPPRVKTIKFYQRRVEGELILFDGAPRSATTTALEQTLLVAIERDGLARLLKREADLAAKLLWSIGRVMAGRLRSTTYSLTADS